MGRRRPRRTGGGQRGGERGKERSGKARNGRSVVERARAGAARGRSRASSGTGTGRPTGKGAGSATGRRNRSAGPRARGRCRCRGARSSGSTSWRGSPTGCRARDSWSLWRRTSPRPAGRVPTSSRSGCRTRSSGSRQSDSVSAPGLLVACRSGRLGAASPASAS